MVYTAEGIFYMAEGMELYNKLNCRDVILAVSKHIEMHFATLRTKCSQSCMTLRASPIIVPFSLCSGLNRCSGSNVLSGIPCSARLSGLRFRWNKHRCVHFIHIKTTISRRTKPAKDGAATMAICRLVRLRGVNRSSPMRARKWPIRTWNT